MKKAFTLMELVIVIAITAILSGVVLFSAVQYINRGKDSSVVANLAVFLSSGEAYYNGNNNSYQNFCDPNQNSVVKNAISQMPEGSGNCYNLNKDPSTWTKSYNPAGVCCKEASNGQSWAACAREFTDSSKAYCVDSRGVGKKICCSQCSSNITVCPTILPSCSLLCQ